MRLVVSFLMMFSCAIASAANYTDAREQFRNAKKPEAKFLLGENGFDCAQFKPSEVVRMPPVRFFTTANAGEFKTVGWYPETYQTKAAELASDSVSIRMNGTVLLFEVWGRTDSPVYSQAIANPNMKATSYIACVAGTQVVKTGTIREFQSTYAGGTRLKDFEMMRALVGRPMNCDQLYVIDTSTSDDLRAVTSFPGEFTFTRCDKDSCESTFKTIHKGNIGEDGKELGLGLRWSLQYFSTAPGVGEKWVGAYGNILAQAFDEYQLIRFTSPTSFTIEVVNVLDKTGLPATDAPLRSVSSFLHCSI